MRSRSLYTAYTIKSMSRTKPTCEATSRFLTERGRPSTASQTKNSRCPPSSMGTGKRFRRNRLTLMTAVKNARLGSPWRACSPAVTAIWIGPPMFFRSSWPTAIL